MIKEALRLGQELPDRIKNAPTLDDYSQFYFDAFFDLNSERSRGFGEGPIPISAVYSYADHHELNDEEEADLAFFIQAMDAAYLKYREKQNKK